MEPDSDDFDERKGVIDYAVSWLWWLKEGMGDIAIEYHGKVSQLEYRNLFDVDEVDEALSQRL